MRFLGCAGRDTLLGNARKTEFMLIGKEAGMTNDSPPQLIENNKARAAQTLHETREGTERRLRAVVLVVRKLHQYASAERLDSEGCAATGRRWERYCRDLEEWYGLLPQVVRQALDVAENPIRNAWVLLARPTKLETIPKFDPLTRQDFVKSGGSCKYVSRCVDWDVEYAPQHFPMTVRALLENGGWDVNWQEPEDVLRSAEKVFDAFARRRPPTRARLKTVIMARVIEGHPDWLAMDDRPVTPEVDRGLLTGLHVPPEDLIDLRFQEEVELKFWPHDIGRMLNDLLSDLLAAKDLHLRLLRYATNPDERPDPNWYYTLGRIPKAPESVMLGRIPDLDENSGEWITQIALADATASRQVGRASERLTKEDRRRAVDAIRQARSKARRTVRSKNGDYGIDALGRMFHRDRKDKQRYWYLRTSCPELRGERGPSLR